MFLINYCLKAQILLKITIYQAILEEKKILKRADNIGR